MARKYKSLPSHLNQGLAPVIFYWPKDRNAGLSGHSLRGQKSWINGWRILRHEAVDHNPAKRSSSLLRFAVAILVRPNIRPTEIKYHRKNHGATKKRSPIVRIRDGTDVKIGHLIIIMVQSVRKGKEGKAQTPRVPAKNNAKKGSFSAKFRAHNSC